MRLRIATWNVNSVRLRHEHAARFVAEQAPDVLCLQEIKCREGEFPTAAFEAMGLPHLKIAGQKGWHGVAIASRLPLEETAGQLALAFSDNPMQLKSWAVTDAQGRTTQVRIDNLERTSGLDAGLFVLKDPRPRNVGRGKL